MYSVGIFPSFHSSSRYWLTVLASKIHFSPRSSVTIPSTSANINGNRGWNIIKCFCRTFRPVRFINSLRIIPSITLPQYVYSLEFSCTCVLPVLSSHSCWMERQGFFPITTEASEPPIPFRRSSSHSSLVKSFVGIIIFFILHSPL